MSGEFVSPSAGTLIAPWIAEKCAANVLTTNALRNGPAYVCKDILVHCTYKYKRITSGLLESVFEYMKKSSWRTILQNPWMSLSVTSSGLVFITSARIATADEAIALWYESHNRWVVYFESIWVMKIAEVLTIAVTASFMPPTVPLYTASHIQRRAFSASWLVIFHGFEEKAAYQNTVGMNLCRKRLLSILPCGRSSFRYLLAFRVSSGFDPSRCFETRSTLTMLCRHCSDQWR